MERMVAIESRKSKVRREAVLSCGNRCAYEIVLRF
jgi:hypothetical protein